MKPPITRTLQESLSEIDWDLLDELDALDGSDGDPAQADQDLILSKYLESMQKPWTKQEMLDAGIPEQLHSMVTWFDSLEEAKEKLAAAGAKFPL